MRTGRRRRKEETPEQKAPAPRPAPQAPRTEPSRPASSRVVILAVLAAVVGLLVLGAAICGGAVLFNPSPQAERYVAATAEGSWQTTVRVLIPQSERGEGWRSDCEADADCIVVAGTCERRQRQDEFTEREVDAYDDYAYNIYYEETEEEVYEASGTEFVITQLNPPEDWVEDDRHYYAEEWLDKETCQYTQYAVWITDPDDPEFEIEVLLSECEVWKHVVVKERIYGEEEYCETEITGTFAVRDTLTEQGAGVDVVWPEAAVPADGRLERIFAGTVVFRAEGIEHVVDVDEAEQYVYYLTAPHYLGLDAQGRVVAITDQAP